MNRIVKSALNDFSLFVSPLGKNRAIYGVEGVISLKLGYMPPDQLLYYLSHLYGEIPSGKPTEGFSSWR